jgi:hypothetical protein
MQCISSLTADTRTEPPTGSGPPACPPAAAPSTAPPPRCTLPTPPPPRARGPAGRRAGGPGGRPSGPHAAAPGPQKRRGLPGPGWGMVGERISMREKAIIDRVRKRLPGREIGLGSGGSVGRRMENNDRQRQRSADSESLSLVVLVCACVRARARTRFCFRPVCPSVQYRH